MANLLQLRQASSLTSRLTVNQSAGSWLVSRTVSAEGTRSGQPHPSSLGNHHHTFRLIPVRSEENPVQIDSSEDPSPAESSTSFWVNLDSVLHQADLVKSNM